MKTGFLGFLRETFRASMQHGVSGKRVMEEAYHIGVYSLPILLTITAFVGTNLSIQGYYGFKELGGQRLIGMFVALAGVREMAPLMVAAMVAAKAGTEMASHLAVMRMEEQIDALEVMAVEPRAWLVTPKVLGIVLVLPALTVISIGSLVLAAWATAVFQLNLNGGEFLTMCWANMRPWDLAAASIKGMVFGAVIALVSCYFGFHARPGPAGVGRATNLAVVVSAVSCAVLNYSLSELMYG